MNVPALAARAPLGATKTATGTGEARIALITSRIEVSSPPGVSTWRMTSSAPSFAARSMPRFAKWALAGPMAPSSGTSTTGAADARAQTQHPKAAIRIARICSGLCSAAAARAPVLELPAEVLDALRRLGGGDVLAVAQVGFRPAGATRHEAPGADNPVAEQPAPAPAVLRVEEIHGERAQ